MTENTEVFVKGGGGEGSGRGAESKIGNLSVRALLALIVTSAICVMSAMGLEVKEPLYTMGGMMIAFYFAQREKPKGQGN